MLFSPLVLIVCRLHTYQCLNQLRFVPFPFSVAVDQIISIYRYLCHSSDTDRLCSYSILARILRISRHCIGMELLCDQIEVSTKSSPYTKEIPYSPRRHVPTPVLCGPDDLKAMCPETSYLRPDGSSRVYSEATSVSAETHPWISFKRNETGSDSTQQRKDQLLEIRRV